MITTILEFVIGPDARFDDQINITQNQCPSDFGFTNYSKCTGERGMICIDCWRRNSKLTVASDEPMFASDLDDDTEVIDEFADDAEPIPEYDNNYTGVIE